MNWNIFKIGRSGVFVGLTAALAATLSGIAQPVITSQPTSQSVVLGGQTSFNVAVSGDGPFTYQWRLNGTNLPNQMNLINRVAGLVTGTTFSGDGGLATSAGLSAPSGVASDSAGRLYIADSGHYRIRMVDTNYTRLTNGLIGIIHTIAGSGAGATSGDGGYATNAGFFPTAVAVDGGGNIFICDSGNNRLRKIDTNGIITTLAGTNSSGFSGDGGLAVNAKLVAPYGVAVDGWGNVFIADRGNSRIRKISTNGIITTVAGTNSSGFSGDGGLAVNAKLATPVAVAVDGSGNLFIADPGNARIRKVDANGIITTFAGTNSAGFSGDGGAAITAALNYPNGVAVDAYGDVFISDYGNSRIRMVNAAGNISTIAGTGGTGNAGDGGLATQASVYNPLGVGVDTDGNLYIAGGGSGTIRKVDLGRTPRLQLMYVATTNEGNYDVIVSSSSGSVTSSVATLKLLLPPSITNSPASLAAAEGGPASFQVGVSGDAPFSYQWFTSSGRAATADALVFGGQVLMVTVWDAGAGYVTAPQVHFSGGGGSGAAGYASLAGGQVVTVYISMPGSGYTSPPTVQIDPPTSTFDTILPGETNATLAWPAITQAEATNYFVVITNNYGSVTSSAARLLVFIPPQNLTATKLATGLQLQFTGTPYYTYLVQSATNLTPPISWQYISTNYADVNGRCQFIDTRPDSGQRFYRARGW